MITKKKLAQVLLTPRAYAATWLVPVPGLNEAGLNATGFARHQLNVLDCIRHQRFCEMLATSRWNQGDAELLKRFLLVNRASIVKESA